MERTGFRLLVGLAAISAAAVALLAFGAGGAELLYVAPVALLVVPLLSGRYVGERSIHRLGARRATRPRRIRIVPAALSGPGPARSFPRGGLLVAASLAERGPPGAALAR